MKKRNAEAANSAYASASGAKWSPAEGALLPEFVGRESCAKCHEEQAQAFMGSHHERAMDHANEATVLGNFDGDSLSHHGMVSRFYRRDGKFLVETEGPDGSPEEFEVKYTFGVKPLQQYLVEFPGGRLQALSTAWDTEKREWFHLYPHTEIAPDDWLHWTRDGQNWNGMCADCHSTGFKRGYDIEKNVFNTSFKEINVSCEACHGPGSHHVDWAESAALSRWISGHGPADNYGLVADHMGDSTHAGANAEIMACGRCHARRSALQTDFGQLKNFLDEYTPELLRDNIYHGDGQIDGEVFEYGSFLQSRMYHEGVRCTDCHEPHSLKLRAPGNALCLQCHEPARFNVEAHFRHPIGTPGSRCIDCHMPSKYYMEVDLRRDHSFRVPRPDLSVQFGTPNACTQCHADKPASWAAEWVEKWHGPERKPHFSELLAKGRSGEPGSDTALARLAAESGHPAIVRASALDRLTQYMGDLARSSLLQAAGDSEPLVRHAAATGIQQLPDVDRIDALTPLLGDSLRAVRVAAASALITASPLLPDSARPDYAKALREHREALDANAYFPGGRFNLGQYYDKLGRSDSAISAYTSALELDNRFTPARINLAHMLERLGRSAEAEFHFRESIRLTPDFADAYYSLGLLLAGRGKLDSAAVYLASASERLPGNARVHYNLGLVLQKLGANEGAVKALTNAVGVSGGEPDFLYALAWLHSTLDQWDQVETLVYQLATLAPNYPGLSGLLGEMARRRGPPSN